MPERDRDRARARRRRASRCGWRSTGTAAQTSTLVGLGRAPRHPARPGRADRPARRRPPLHRPRLPAGDARRRRHPAGRLRAGAVAALQSRLRRLGADRRQRHALRPRRRADVGVDPGAAGPAADAPAVRVHARRAAARVLPATGFPALLPEWGYGFWKSRDVYEHQDDVLEDFDGFAEHEIPLDAIVLDSPWATQYNTLGVQPLPVPRRARDDRDDARARRAHRGVGHPVGQPRLARRTGAAPAGVRAAAPRAGAPVRRRRRRRPLRAGQRRAVRDASGGWAPARRSTSRAPPPRSGGARRSSGCWRWASRGSRPTTATATTSPTASASPTGGRGASAAWALGGLHRLSLQRALDEVHPGSGVLFGRSGWAGQQAIGLTWGGDQVSDFWSLRALVVATLSAACSGISNWSHDVGGYLGYRLVERCPPELLLRWLQFGCFTPLMHAHARMPQEPWRYSERVLDLYRGYVLAARAAGPVRPRGRGHRGAHGLPIIRPQCLIDPTDPRGWTIGDAYGYGPALWVAPVLDDGAREREVALPRGEWIETWSGERVSGRPGDRRAGAAGADPRVGARGLDRRHVSGRARRRRARATRPSQSGRSSPRCGEGPGSDAPRAARRRHSGGVAERTVVVSTAPADRRRPVSSSSAAADV